MATGDEALAAGLSTVEYSGSEPSASVRNGGEEINRTRDYIARLMNSMLEYVTSVPINKGGTGATNKTSARSNLGVSSGTTMISDTSGEDGDIFFLIVS